MSKVWMLVGGIILVQIVLGVLNKEHRLTIWTVLESLVMFVAVSIAYTVYAGTLYNNQMLLVAIVCSFPLIWSLYPRNRSYWIVRHFYWRLPAMVFLFGVATEQGPFEPGSPQWILFLIGAGALTHLGYLWIEMTVGSWSATGDWELGATPGKRMVGLVAILIGTWAFAASC